jgi:hypothetical protein
LHYLSLVFTRFRAWVLGTVFCILGAAGKLTDNNVDIVLAISTHSF